MNGFYLSYLKYIMLNYIRLNYLLNALRTLGSLPPHILISKNGKLITALFYEKKAEQTLFANVEAGAGTASNLSLASLKGLSEYAERRAFYESNPYLKAPNSTGFSAFPLFLHSVNTVKKYARQHAFYEALERWVWQRWWHNSEIGTDIIKLADLNSQHRKVIDNLLQSLPDQANQINELQFLIPKTEKMHCLVIAVAHLNPYGYIAGGAAASYEDTDSAMTHAVVEMLRHLQAFNRGQELKLVPNNMYEKKIYFFASGQGDALVENRIQNSGNQILVPPQLTFDAEIPHALQRYFYVHRCIFEGQFALPETEHEFAY